MDETSGGGDQGEEKQRQCDVLWRSSCPGNIEEDAMGSLNSKPPCCAGKE